jgi:hypothetical protein
MEVLQQLIENILVPNSQTTTLTLSELINYALLAYVRTTNWKPPSACIIWTQLVQVGTIIPLSFDNSTLSQLFSVIA